MIKVSFISPTSLIEEYGNRGDFHLTLAHLLSNEPNDYEKKIVESSLPIYLDNGLFENGVSIEIHNLINHACRLKAKYVFVPDVLYDRKGTEENVKVASEILGRANERYKSDVKLAAVVQANNVDDYIESYQWMVENELISLIGLSILSIPKSFEEVLERFDIVASRLRLLEILKDLPKNKDCHLLGAGDSYKDVIYAAENCPFVKSHDSSSAIWNGVQKHRMFNNGEIHGGKTKVPVDFDWNEELFSENKEIIENNIKNVLAFTNHESD